MDQLSLEKNHPNQFRCKVGKYVVAYICYGEGMPINWLPKSVSGLTLTDQEKIEVAKFIRREMQTHNAAKQSEQDELARLSAPGYIEETNAADQGSDSISTSETEDA